MMGIASFLIATATFAIPNPSWRFCVENGGTYETRLDSSGAQDGVCMFNNEGSLSECGGWAYVRGECAPGECARWSVEAHACETLLP